MDGLQDHDHLSKHKMAHSLLDLSCGSFVMFKDSYLPSMSILSLSLSLDFKFELKRGRYKGFVKS